VIARTAGKLIGRENVAGPTLSSLNGDFGLAPLIGKSLAVVSDARLSGRGAHVVVERLLSISGEDTLTVNIKYREQWTGKLPARLMICSNELPQLGDASMAIAGRFVPLLLNRSWLGNEDRDLEPDLDRELTGILNWALDGLERLTRQGRFTQPGSTEDTLRALQELASPVAAFVREECVVAANKAVRVDVLYREWCVWAELNGHGKSTTQVFGRNLRAAVPGVRTGQVRTGGDVVRWFRGITLRDPAKAAL
jgi:putative DNA primase/helicase